MAEITTERLDEIEQRTMDASGGPWEAYRLRGTVRGEDDTFGVDDRRHATLFESSRLRGEDAEFIAHARTDLPDLTAAVRAVRELHQEETRYQPWPDYEGSFDSAEAIAEHFGEPDAGEEWPREPHTFGICTECGRIEREANEGHDEWSYRESLWPCPTAKAVGVDA